MTVQGWLFIFAILGAIGSIFKILEYFGITPKKAPAGGAPVGNRRTLVFACVLIAVSLVMSSVGLYISIARPPIPTSAEWDEYLKNLEVVRGKNFSDQEVQMDGKMFIDCKFTSVVFTYDGTRPFVLLHNDIDAGGKPLYIKVRNGPAGEGAEVVGWAVNSLCKEKDMTCLQGLHVEVYK